MTKKDLESLVLGMRLAEQSMMDCRRGGAFRRENLEVALRTLSATRDQGQALLDAWPADKKDA